MKYINLLTTGLKSDENFLTHPRLLIKFDMKVLLKQNGINGNLLETSTNFINDKKQRVVLNGQYSILKQVSLKVQFQVLISNLKLFDDHFF